MFEVADHLELPLTPEVCHIISLTYPGDIAHLIILRRARNICWQSWHAPEIEMYDRSQSQVGYRILQDAIEIGIKKAIDSLERGDVN